MVVNCVLLNWWLSTTVGILFLYGAPPQNRVCWDGLLQKSKTLKMDTFLIQIVQLMSAAEKEFDSGHDKKACVLHGAQQLLHDSDLVVDTTVIDGFIDVVCMMSRNKAMLQPLTRGCRTCFQ